MSISRFDIAPSPAGDPRLALLRGWLSIGVVMLVLLPPSQWHTATLGWLPYWLLVAPLISLALLRRRHLATALKAFVVRDRRRCHAGARRDRMVTRSRRSVPSLRRRSDSALIPR